ncbi:MAG TPA: nitroreductase family protein [Burkholderiaceae bacterium]|jgi:nitroreductase|nr:nitroreductase family protein [Burkholderiaceae bacterium]
MHFTSTDSTGAVRESIDLLPGQAATALSPLGLSLTQILKKRQSTREFSDRELSLQTLSALLWSAFGINRPAHAHRTAPSAKNWQEIDIYVALTQGLYLFDAAAPALRLLVQKDIRAATGWQDFVPHVPVNLVYVADLAKMDPAPKEEKKFYAAADTGFIAQNVYLFCAAEGLATVIRGWVDRPALAATMELRPEQRVIMAQSVGYPKT